MPVKHSIERIRWHSRRGLLELDLILVPFTEKYFAELSDADKDDYVALLACEDQDIFAWLFGHAQPQDSKIASIVALIRNQHGRISAS